MFQRDAAQTWGNIRYDVLAAMGNIGQQLSENRFAVQNGLCETNHNIDSVKAEAYQNTCAITNAIHMEAEQTRALITDNTIQNLRDRLESKDRELQSALFTNSQLGQNATIIEAIRPTPQPAYIVSSPYASTPSCGCGL